MLQEPIARVTTFAVPEAVRLDPSLEVLADGERCQDSQCQAACCPGGLVVDLAHVQRIYAAVEQIRPFVAEPYRLRDDLWFDDDPQEDPDLPSGVGLPTAIAPRVAKPEEDGCVFLRDDHLCALQVASDANGMGWPGWKPFDCAIYPLRRSGERIWHDAEAAADCPGGHCEHTPTGVRRPRTLVFAEELQLARRGPR